MDTKIIIPFGCIPLIGTILIEPVESLTSAEQEADLK